LVLSSPGVFGHADDVLEDPWRWSHFTDDDGFPAPSALRVKEKESADGVLWAAKANGLDWFDGYQWHPVADTLGAPPNQFTGSINTPASGGVAVGVSGSVYVGDQSGFETIAIPGETIDFSAVTPDGDFVLLTRESGLYLWREGIVEPMSPPEGVGSTGINHLGASDARTVWRTSSSATMVADSLLPPSPSKTEGCGPGERASNRNGSRRARRSSRIPIVALTANAMESDREQCLGAGMDDFVAKPVRKQALRRGLAQFSFESGPALPTGPDSSTSDEQILDPQPLDELRELAEFDADFSISSFIDLFLEEAPKTLARAVTACQEADVELSIGMCTR